MSQFDDVGWHHRVRHRLTSLIQSSSFRLKGGCCPATVARTLIVLGSWLLVCLSYETVKFYVKFSLIQFVDIIAFSSKHFWDIKTHANMFLCIAKQTDNFDLCCRAVGTFARALDCSSSIRQPSLHMSAAAASRDITLVRMHVHKEGWLSSSDFCLAF